MRVLITGHMGFVGRAFWRHLRDGGHEVIGDDLVHGVDCRDVLRADWSYFDLVIHCAAVVGGRGFIDGSPLQLAAEDLSIDAELFRWALRTRPGRIVYFSSSAVYPPILQGRVLPVPLCEGHTRSLPGQHDQTYGLVKAVGERLAAEANAIGIPVHVFRPFSGYGDHQALDYPFPAFIRRGVQREMPFDVWGRGDSARDWIHIDDIVGAVMAAVDQDVRGPVNICTGRATTFDELATEVMRQVGYQTCIRHVDDAPQGVHWRVGDPTQLHEFYVPKVTLEEGIARALESATNQGARA